MRGGRRRAATCGAGVIGGNIRWSRAWRTFAASPLSALLAALSAFLCHPCVCVLLLCCGAALCRLVV